MLGSSDDIRGNKMSFDFLPIKRLGKATEVAELIAWLLCEQSGFITGTVQNIDGGWIC
jgi:NAD(P)-dependent dehydrogenase (short-subunit alcohol dehydrogenase family)